MPEILFFLAVLIAIVTVVGHGMWMMIAAIFGQGRNDPGRGVTRRDADADAFRRVVLRLRDAEKLPPDEAERLLHLAEQQALSQRLEQEPVMIAELLSPRPARRPRPGRSLAAEVGDPRARQSRRSQENSSAAQPHPLDQIDAPSAAPLAPRSYAADARHATAHVMRSFLVEHNIRWGELIAGLLIVVCSVGLVISLWNTLEQTHILLPSLVFMLGTAGVEGAGLYTLTRWRLRTTSRAMLVIASLLVPLNVVAGIAVARGGDAPISLLDPITAFTMVLSAAVYGVLMWWAGRAILGRSPWRWVVAVVGPAFALVFFRSLIVDFGADAGWAAVLPALCVIGALVTETAGHARVGSGRAARTMTLAAVAVYAAGVAVVFLGLQIHTLPGALVAIATAVMPAAIFVAGWAFWLHTSATGSSATWVRLAGTSIAILCGLVVISIFPPALVGLRYALGWCGVVAISALLTALIHRQAALLYGTAAATGLAIILIVPQLTYASPWDGAAGLIRRITGGPAGSLWVGYAIGLAAVGWRLRSAWEAAGRVLIRSAAIAGAVGIASSALVSLGPTQWTEPVPIAVSWLLLGLASGLALLAAGQREQLTSVAGVLIVVFWLGILRGAEGWPAADASLWVHLIGAVAIATLSSLSAAVLVGSVLGRLHHPPAWSAGLIAWQGAQLFRWAIAVGAVAAICAAGQFAWDPRSAVLSWTVIAAWGIALGLVRRMAPVLVGGQLAGLVALLGLGQMRAWWTLSPENWSRGPMLWQLVAVVLLYAVVWAVVRRLLHRGPYQRFTSSGQAGGWGFLADQPLGYFALLGGVLAAVLSMAIAIRQSLQSLVGMSPSEMVVILPPLPSAGWLIAAILTGGTWVVLTCMDRDAWISGEDAAAGDNTAAGATRSGMLAAVIGILFAAAMSAITGLVVLQTPWNVAAGTTATVAISLLLLVGFRMASRRGRLNHQQESALWPVCLLNTLAWAGPVVATWGFVVLATQRDLSANMTAAMAAVVATLLLLWAVAGVLLWSWYRCQQADWLAIGSIAVAAVVGYAGTLGRPDENGIIQWLAVAGTTLWALAVAMAWSDRAGLTRVLERWGTVNETSHLAAQSGVVRESSHDPSADAAQSALLQTGPWLAVAPALAAGLIAMGIATVAITTLLQISPHAFYGALPGPTASHVAIFFWLVSLVGAWMLVVRPLEWFGQLANQSPWSLSAWILAIASGWTALVGLRLFAWGDLVVAWSWGLGQLTLAMLVALYPLFRFAMQRCPERDASAARRSELTALVMIVLVLAAVGYGWAHAVERALPVACATLAVWGYFLLATVGQREARDRRGLIATLLAIGVMAVAICWPTPAVRWGLSSDAIRRTLPWVAVVLALCGAYWRAVWFRSERIAMQRRTAGAAEAAVVEHTPLWVDGVVLAMAAVAAAFFTLLDVAEFASAGRSAHYFPWRAAGAVALALTATIAAVSAMLRVERPGQTFAAHLLTVAPLLSMWTWVADSLVLSPAAVWAGCGMTLALTSALAAWALPVALQWSYNIRPAAPVEDAQLHDRPWRDSLAYYLGLALVCMAAAMITGIFEVDAAVRWCWIGATIASAVAIGRSAAQLPSAIESRTVAAGLIAAAALVGSITDVGSVTTTPAQLQILMQGLVAATVLVGAISGMQRSLVLDPLLWTEPLRRVTRACLATAGIVMAVMLTVEAVQPDSVTASVPTRVVMGAAVAMVALAAAALYLAIHPALRRDDHEDHVASWLASGAGRQTLVHLSQALLVLAWLHVELCRPGWIPEQFRGYWPLMVMGVAFGSAGLMHWAERRGPDILVNPLRRTAVLLPLVPVFGFWLSADGGERALLPWDVPYSLVLVLVAAYYGGLAIWGQHRSWTAAGSVIAGNAAIWVVLSDQPGWEFVTHPQLWLIPPAASVLAAAQLERERLTPAMLAAVRYIATLVIYVSSTADLLVQQIGNSLSGPIILILLSLAGMAAGVIFQVRAFLFLGAAFVLVSVLSMVWHAQRAIDQVWPWWAFGITTGLLLLTALMLIERFRPAVQDLVMRLGAWEK